MKRSDLRTVRGQYVSDDDLRSMAPELLAILLTDLKPLDMPVMVLCGHQGSFDPEGKILDGRKRHPLGESIGFNRGGGKMYAKWCSGPQGIGFDAAARRLGYVRLDGVDLEALRRLVERVESKPPTRVSGPDIRWLVDAATMLLAALAEGDTTNE